MCTAAAWGWFGEAVRGGSRARPRATFEALRPPIEDAHVRLPLAAVPVPALAAALLVSACAGSVPRDAAIPGSRPGLTDDEAVVPTGSVQAEAGLDAGRFAGEDFLAGELLLRFGALPGLEARLAVESEGGRGGDGPGQAVGDLEVGLKIALHDPDGRGAVPVLSLLPALSLPTGADRLTAGGVEPGAFLVAAWEGPGPEWTANLGAAAARGEGGRFLDLFLGVAAGHAVTGRLDLEAEVVRTLERGGHADGPGLRHAAFGAAWLLQPDLQLDAWAGVQREGDARGRFLGLGVSVRR